MLELVDPKNQIDENGGLIIDSTGLIKAVGKDCRLLKIYPSECRKN